MTDFGGKLRQAREARGVSLRQISARTKISVAALEALERNDISKLPGGVFSRAFVRSYATEVGLDPDETMHEFVQRFHADPSMTTTGRSVHATPAEMEFDQRRRHAARMFIAAVVFMLIASAVVMYLMLQFRPVDEAPPGQPATAAPALAPAGDRLRADTAVPAAAPPASPVAPAIETAQQLRIEVRATAACWISGVADGRKVVERVVPAGEVITLVARDLAVITVGDAGACALTINGRAARPLGGSGEVKTVRISPQTLDRFLR